MPGRLTGEGLVGRLSPIAGITPPAALSSAVYFPAFLNDFTDEETALHNEYDTLTGGHFSQAAMGDHNARQLRTITADSIIVDFDTDWLVATGQDPWALRETFTRILRYRKPVLLMVSFNPTRHQPGPEIYMYCTFRRLTKTVKNGELETRYLTVELSEWRDPGSNVRSATAPATSRKRGVPLPATRKLTATDTLQSLSFAYYGRYDWWRFIRDANGLPKQFGQKTPIVHLKGKWRVGVKVKIPKVATPKAGKNPKAHIA